MTGDPHKPENGSEPTTPDEQNIPPQRHPDPAPGTTEEFSSPGQEHEAQPDAHFPQTPTDAFGRPLNGDSVSHDAAIGATSQQHPGAQPPPGHSNHNTTRRGGVALVAALAIGALIGGAAGGGVVAAIVATTQKYL
jgi:putative serine protease PepD